MPTRGQSGQLDEISQRIGELTAYTHEHRHGVNNLSAKFDALALDIVKRVEALDTKMTVRIDEVVKALTAENSALASRIAQLEAGQEREKGARGVLAWIFQSPVMGWLVGGAAALWALFSGKVHG